MRGPGSEACLGQAKDGVIPSTYHVAPPHARELVSDKPDCLCARYASMQRIVSALARYTYVAASMRLMQTTSALACKIKKSEIAYPGKRESRGAQGKFARAIRSTQTNRQRGAGRTLKVIKSWVQKRVGNGGFLAETARLK